MPDAPLRSTDGQLASMMLQTDSGGMSRVGMALLLAVSGAKYTPSPWSHRNGGLLGRLSKTYSMLTLLAAALSLLLAADSTSGWWLSARMLTAGCQLKLQLHVPAPAAGCSHE